MRANYKNEYVDIENKLMLNIKQKTGLIKLFEENDQCPTCQQKLDGQHCSHIVVDQKKAIEEMSEGLTNVGARLAKLTDQFENL